MQIESRGLSAARLLYHSEGNLKVCDHGIRRDVGAEVKPHQSARSLKILGRPSGKGCFPQTIVRIVLERSPVFMK